MVDNGHLISSYSVITETDTFILIKDNDSDGFASVTTAAAYTIESLVEKYDLNNRRVLYLDSMNRFDELCHNNGKFTKFKALSTSQQLFYRDLLAKHESAGEK